MSASKSCLHCGAEFFREGRQPTHWKKQKYCSLLCSHKNHTREFVGRFWEKVIRGDGCWLWTGTKSEGYGLFSVNLPNHFRMAKAHRIAWELANSASLLPASVIMHTCDNPGCCNPAHLVLGTQRENTADMLRKGRCPPRHGHHNGRAVLSEDVIKKARVLRNGGRQYTEIAQLLGVPYGALWNALNGRTWRHVDAA